MGAKGCDSHNPGPQNVAISLDISLWGSFNSPDGAHAWHIWAKIFPLLSWAQRQSEPSYLGGRRVHGQVSNGQALLVGSVLRMGNYTRDDDTTYDYSVVLFILESFSIQENCPLTEALCV